jgi:hypothetical protein
MENFCVYYQNVFGDVRAYHYDTKTFKDYKFLLQIQTSSFYIAKTKSAYYVGENLDEELMKYADTLYKEALELKQCLSFDYLTPSINKRTNKTVYHNHESNVVRFFMFYCSKYITKYTDISFKESMWIEKCANSGLIYCEKGTFNNCFGYDYKKFYQNIMKDDKFIVPYDEGKEMNLKKIPEKLICGFYRCKIESNNQDFNKLFRFSKDNVYTNNSLKFCLENKDKLSINVSLIIDGQPNAYYYYLKKQCSKFNETCDKYIASIEQFQKEFPKNSLGKLLSSKLWGSLCKGNKKTVTGEAVKQQNISIGHSFETEYRIIKESFDSEGNILYKIQSNKKPYLYGIARLKPFITDFGRCKVMRTLVNEGLEKTLRVCTDGIILKNKIDNLEQYGTLLSEDEKTGDLQLTYTNEKVIKL